MIARSSCRGYFIHSLSTLYYYNAPSLATRLTGDYRDRTFTGKCGPASLDTQYNERTTHLPVEPSFRYFFLTIFSTFNPSQKCFFRSIISSIRSIYSVIFFTFSTRIRFVSLPLLVLIFSGKTSFVVEPAPQAIIVWRSSKVRPCLDTKVKENKLSLIKLIF